MNDLYIGYVEAKDKRPIETLKGRENFKSLEEVQGCKEYSGILAKDTVLIDFDDLTSASIAMRIICNKNIKCRCIHTNRGMHLLMKQPQKAITSNYIGRQLSCGLVADIKTGVDEKGNEKISAEYLKDANGVRGTMYDEVNENGEYDTVPPIFWPTKIKKDDNIDFINMGEGDGRNDALYKYIITLSKTITDRNIGKECIRTLNEHVLKTPVPEKELETIIRDESWDGVRDMGAFYTERGSLMFDKFAQYFVEQNNVIKINGNLFVYKDGVYVNGTEEIERAMIKHISDLTSAKRSEIIAYINLLIENESEPSQYDNYIAFRNGLYDIATKKLVPFSPSIIVLNKIDWNYNPKAYSQIVDKILDNLSDHDEQIRAILEECAGYPFYRRNELGKAFFFKGKASNGKSVFQSMLQKLYGTKNTTSLDMSQLSDRFSTASLLGKIANIGDDIKDGFIDDNNIFKTIVTGGRLKAEYKGQQEFEFTPYVKLIFSANNMPKTRDKTGAVLRRMEIIPFTHQFGPSDPDFDPYISYKVLNGTKESSVDNNMSYMINLALKGLDRVLTNNKFTECGKVKEAIDEYDTENNPVKSFLQDMVELYKAPDVVKALVGRPAKDIYKLYVESAEEDGSKPMSKIEFGRFLSANYNLKSSPRKIDGVTMRVFAEA